MMPCFRRIIDGDPVISSQPALSPDAGTVADSASRVVPMDLNFANRFCTNSLAWIFVTSRIDLMTQFFSVLAISRGSL